MKKNKNLTVLYYVGAIFFYIAAIVGYASDNSMATVWFCLGSAWLCLGTASGRKNKKDESKDDEE